jgi:hypothetical protein
MLTRLRTNDCSSAVSENDALAHARLFKVSPKGQIEDHAARNGDCHWCGFPTDGQLCDGCREALTRAAEEGTEEAMATLLKRFYAD